MPSLSGALENILVKKWKTTSLLIMSTETNAVTKKSTKTYLFKITCRIIKDHSYNNFQVFWNLCLLHGTVITCVFYTNKEILLWKQDNNKLIFFFIFALWTLIELIENEGLFWKTWMNRKYWK